jgi:hypothetical protein
MSGRTISRFAVVGLLVAAVAVPIGAQYQPRQFVTPTAQAQLPQSAMANANPLPQPPATVTKPTIVGTWYREFGSKLCVIKIAPTYMTMTVTMAKEGAGGKTVTGSYVAVADYRVSRDEITITGSITGVDLHIEGEIPMQDEEELLGYLEQDRKALENKEFTLTFRLCDDTLVIGNLRMPVQEGSSFPFQKLMGGCYKMGRRNYRRRRS